MRAVNGFVIRHIVGLTATKNIDGETVGLANRVFSYVYLMRAPLKRIKKANRRAYYAVKYTLIVAALWVAVFGGYRVLH